MPPASALGGVDYVYAMRGDGRVPVTPVPGERQRAALAALLRTLAPAELAMPESVLQRIPPRPPGHDLHRELFPRRTGPVFDALTPALVAADLTVSQILNAERAARLVEQALLDETLPDLEEVLKALIDAAFAEPAGTPYEREIQRAVQRVVAERLMGLAERAPMAAVRAHARVALDRHVEGYSLPQPYEEQYPQHRLLQEDVERFLARPGGPLSTPPVPVPAAPPGSPIGAPALDWLGTLPDPCAWDRRPGF